MTDPAAASAPPTGDTVEVVTGDDVVALEVPADVAFTGVVRSLAANLAARLPFTIDEIDDLRIAVDEALSLLLPLATPGSGVRTAFHLRPEGIDVVADVAAAADAPALDRGGFSWTVLDALAHVTDVREGDGAVGLTLHKAAEEAAEAGLTAGTAADPAVSAAP